MTIEECRRFYAEEIRLAANITSPVLVDAFAKVPREKFLGPAPWHLLNAELAAMSSMGIGQYGYLATNEPRDLYHNLLVAIDPARKLNNGHPGTLACYINALDIAPGNRVFHLGCGVGYYTAIIAEAVGPSGTVSACEVDADLAERARQNLAGYQYVSVQAKDGAQVDPGECDAMLINAGVTHPHSLWLDRLRDGGRLVLPITFATPGAPTGNGVMVKIVRHSNHFSVQVVSFVSIYSSTSVRDPELEPVLTKAFTTRTLLKIQSVRRDQHEPVDNCIVHSSSVCLSSAEAVPPV